MAEVGDRVEVVTKQAGARAGVVLGVTGTMVRIKWDVGGETTMVPGPGVLSVVGKAKAPKARAANAGKAAKPGKPAKSGKDAKAKAKGKK
jgi:hypothetical protein